MSKLHDTLNQQIRETCRACHNVCYVSADADGNAPPVPAEGYRCEGCEAAGYERYDFDRSLQRPEGAVEPADPKTPTGARGASVEPTYPTEPHEPTEPTEATDSTDSEARPSDEPKSGDEAQGEQVVVSSPAPETQ